MRVTGTAATNLDSPQLNRIHMVRLDFASGVVAAHDGIGSFAWNGDTYLGVSEFGSLEVVTEDVSLRPQSIRLQLSGVKDLIGDAATAGYHYRSALIYMMVIDDNNQAVADPVLIWAGRMDSMAVELSEGGAILQLTCMDRLADLTRLRACYLTDEAQQRRHPGDRGLSLAPQAAKVVTVNWGGADLQGGGGGGGGGNHQGPRLP